MPPIHPIMQLQTIDPQTCNEAPNGKVERSMARVIAPRSAGLPMHKPAFTHFLPAEVVFMFTLSDSQRRLPGNFQPLTVPG